MSLDALLQRLYARRRFGIRPGVERVALLLERLGNPEHSFRSLHCVGTNGKGSTAAFLSSIFSAAGYRTALFTSPHLVRFSERFRINGKEICGERLVPLLNRVLEAAPDDATFFEIVTAVAACYFADENVALAIMEAGMGGRSDATAALPGVLTVITSVSLDHCAYLGTTTADIAREKAGIAKPGTTVITACQAPDVMDAITRSAQETGCRLLADGSDFSSLRSDDGMLDYRGVHTEILRLRPALSGRFQKDNATLALAAAEILAADGYRDIDDSALRNGIENAVWPGRMEFIPGSPPLLLDGAHNAAGAEALAASLADIPRNRLFIVLGLVDDKDADALISPLLPLASRVFAVSPAIDRALSADKLAAMITAAGIPCSISSSAAAGIEAARSAADADDLVLVCGSLFLVGEAKAGMKGATYLGIRG